MNLSNFDWNTPISRGRSAKKPKTTPPGRWLCVAEGDEGDALYWKDEYGVLENVRAIFCQLEEFGPDAIPLQELVAGLPAFAHLYGNPPLYRESDFDDIRGMRCGRRLGWGENRWVGMSGAEVRIYIWSRDRKEILSQARVLRTRLQARLEECERMAKENAPKTQRKKSTSKKKAAL